MIDNESNEEYDDDVMRFTEDGAVEAVKFLDDNETRSDED